jgi:putative transcriptional regulator
MNNDLRERREQRELTQSDLASAVGVTRQTINSIERGRYDPSLELAFELAAFFDCRIEDLFHPDGDDGSETES